MMSATPLSLAKESDKEDDPSIRGMFVRRVPEVWEGDPFS